MALLSALQLWEETATRWSAADGEGVATSQNPKALGLLREATRQAAANADPVSYTHLDVYKRQKWNRTPRAVASS